MTIQEPGAPEIPKLDASLFVDVDLFSQEMKADPYKRFAEWGNRPPFYVMVAGRPVVVICRHALVHQAFSDHETFSVRPQPGWGGDSFDYFNGLPTVNITDPPEHSRLRRLMQPAFTPRRIGQLKESIEGVAEGLLEAIAARGAFDMMQDFAEPLSRRVLMGHFFELPEENWDILIDFFAKAALIPGLPPGAPKPQAYLDMFERGRAFFQSYISERRREPKDDVIGAIIAAGDSGDLTSEELFATLLQLFAGGFGTIAGSMTLSMAQLCRHPDQLKILQDDPSLINDAVEECLRIDSLGTFIHRFVMKDTVMEGVPIYRGMMAQVSMGASNYDRDLYPEPERFDVRRQPKDITTFGYGTHYCVGQLVARNVLRTGIGGLVKRFPKIRLADPRAVIQFGGVATERSPISVPMRVD